MTGRPSVIIDNDLRNLESYLEQHPAQPYLHADATDNDVMRLCWFFIHQRQGLILLFF